jgi:DNA-binding response OmpR family regulator
MTTILVVDDEERCRTFLSRSLQAHGHAVVTAPNGQAALDYLADHEANLVLLDLVMPRRNGLEVLGELRDRADRTPVVVLSAVTEVAARIQALDRGAVDFVTKPFHTGELVARVRRHLTTGTARRDTGEERYLTCGELRLDLDRRRVHAGDTDVSLTAREFAVLAHLVRRRGDVCRRDELLSDIWGDSFGAASNVVDACVARLRGKLPSLPLETIRGVGYCLDGA